MHVFHKIIFLVIIRVKSGKNHKFCFSGIATDISFLLYNLSY